jgi:hypothetical protein
VRFEVILDGIEDYEYLKLLDDYREKLAAMGGADKHQQVEETDALKRRINRAVVEGCDRYTEDYRELLKYRELVAEKIIELKSIVNQHSG